MKNRQPRKGNTPISANQLYGYTSFEMTMNGPRSKYHLPTIERPARANVGVRHPAHGSMAQGYANGY